MADNTDANSEVLSAIQAFEQILEAMPNDRASLEALSHAYEQIGDIAKAKEFTIRLGTVLLDEGDEPAALQLLPKIREYADGDPEGTALLERMEKLAPSTTPAPAAEAAPGAATEAAPEKGSDAEAAAKLRSREEAASRSSFNMADELSFAWNLMEAGELTQEEYASVVQDLTEMSAGDSDATVSVLHALEARGFKGLERVIGFVSRECSTPVIAISSFEVTITTATALPMDFMVRRGTLIFEFLGKDALVVVLNPYDKQLQKDVEAVAGRKCHFFVCVPSEFDQSLEKMSEILLEQGSADDEE